jgi:hypothetical protein
MLTDIQYDRCKTARARIRGEKLLIRIPLRWPAERKLDAIRQFAAWAAKQKVLPSSSAPPPFVDPSEFSRLVEKINLETFDVSINRIRLGKARYSRLAQVNVKTKNLTFSRYAVAGMPEKALRYLVVHELAHLLVPNHSSAFWEQVALHVPDFRLQRRIARDHYRASVQQPDG